MCVHSPIVYVGKEGLGGDCIYPGQMGVGKPGSKIYQILNQCVQAFKTQDRFKRDYIWTVLQGSRSSHQTSKKYIVQAIWFLFSRNRPVGRVFLMASSQESFTLSSLYYVVGISSDKAWWFSSSIPPYNANISVKLAY